MIKEFQRPKEEERKTLGWDIRRNLVKINYRIHTDAIQSGEQVLLVDDLIATGGTAEAAIALIQKLDGIVMGAAFVIDLPALGGMNKLKAAGCSSFALCEFEGE